MFVVGHSGGGKAAPRVAAADAGVAGVVIMAAAVDSITRQAARAEGADLSTATPAADLLFGWPASYWLDLREYDQAATAAALGGPVLVLQGRRDYQVTVEDDLARWQAGLAGRAYVTIRVYDADDHLFFAAAGASTPAGYQVPQHVDAAVVADIADWLRSESGRRPIARFYLWPQAVIRGRTPLTCESPLAIDT